MSRIKNLWRIPIRIFRRKGLLGRKEQIKYLHERFIGIKWCEKKIDVKKAKEYYRGLCALYKEIRIHLIDQSERIGEYIPRYLIAVEDSKENVKEGILDVFYLGDYKNINSRLTAIMARNIQIIVPQNAGIWGYILIHFPKVTMKYFWDYKYRNTSKSLNPEETVKYLSISKKETVEAEDKKRLMGLRGEFVCISNRDAAYLSFIFPDADCRYHNYRDSNINNMDLAVSYLADNGIMAVRMGRKAAYRTSFSNCIDYANDFYDELMDVALMKDCKFFVGDSNGTCVLPMALNRACALKNVVPAFCGVWGGHPQNKSNLYIFKKYYSRAKKRYLSIKEMMDIEHKVYSAGRGMYKKYEELQIELIENSPEEILDLVMEMNMRIDGSWIDTDLDLELKKKYDKIFREWCERERLSEGVVLQARVGALFLRKNSFLLN